MALVIFATLFGFRLYQELARQAPRPSWVLATAIAIAAALFFAYFIPWFHVLLPTSIVIFSEKGVNNNNVTGRGAHVRFFPWSCIGRVVAATANFEGISYPVIVFDSTQDEHLATLGLKQSPNLQQIAEYLSDYELELQR